MSEPAPSVGAVSLTAASADELLSAGAALVGLAPGRLGRRLSGHSGAALAEMWTPAGAAVLKVSPRRIGRHELRCYRELVAQLPVRAPALLDWARSDELTVLVLSRHRPIPVATTWTAGTWRQVATDLAALHAAGSQSMFAGRPWLRRPLAAVDLAARQRLWMAAAGDDGRSVERLFQQWPLLQAAADAGPAGLPHGDCHRGNLYLTTGFGSRAGSRAPDDSPRLVWADWQQAGAGRPLDDLALLCQRAEYDGAAVPRRLLLATYADTRGLPRDAALLRAAVAAELLLLMAGWPEFILADPRPILARRLLAFAARWQRLR